MTPSSGTRSVPTVLVMSLLILLFLTMCSSIDAYNILFLSPVTSASHSSFMRPVVQSLVNRGHFVTYWNGLDHGRLLENPSSRLRFFYSPDVGRVNNDHGVFFDDRDSPFRLFFDLPARMSVYCAAIYRDPIYQQLANSTDKFDLVVTDGTFNECVLPLVKTLDVPLVYMVSMVPAPWLLDAIGSSMSLDHVPHPVSSFVDQMNLWQRTYNTLSGWMTSYLHRWLVIPVVDRLASQMLDSPKTSVLDIEDRHLSLMITNTHFSVNYQLPLPPAVIEAGGLHCVPATRSLPQTLKTFVDHSGEDGFIIVSFGSILKGVAMPEKVRHIFLSVFARLEQRVLWKWEDDSRWNDPVPANVKLVSWLPQQELLAHPKVRLFITHCGLMSHQEAVYHGVPFIALPVFADQPINAQKANNDGYAIRLHWDSLSEDVLYEAIQWILNDPGYARRAEQVSVLMRDQMNRPLDRAVYWIEYVIRHQGAGHLRSASRQLSLFQRCLFDVSFILVFGLLTMTYLIFLLAKILRLPWSTKFQFDEIKKMN